MTKTEQVKPTLNVHAAIQHVLAKLSKDGIGKDHKNAQQGYKFRGIDDVYNSLAPILADAGLYIAPKVLARECVERETKAKNALFYVTVHVRYTVTALDGTSIECETYGEAMDSADKATNKAMSAAFKYLCLQLFCIPTEGDNDADATTHEVAPKAPLVSAEDVAKMAEEAKAKLYAVGKAKWAEGQDAFKEWKLKLNEKHLAYINSVEHEYYVEGA